jgi:phytoene dehydrogenase-like protein
VAGADGFDAVVVGSGPNGLVGAVTLAEAGLRVLLIEQADEVGGGLRSGPLTGLDGFTHDLCATVLPLARASAAFRDLDLDVDWAFPSVQAAHPLDGQDAVLIHRDAALTADGLGSRRDAFAWRQSVGVTASGGFDLVDSLLSPLSAPRAPLRLARYGALGLLPATTLARTLFGGERARAALAGMAAHSMIDLRRPITGGYGLLLAALAHQVGWPLVRGGSARLAAALVARLVGLGGVVETGRRVSDLADVPRAPALLFDLTPRQLADVCGDRLPPGYARRLRRYRYGPGAFKLDWALDGPVPWRDPAVAAAATVHLGGTLDEITAAEAAVAAGRHPERPYVLAVQPCAADPSRAPAGQHVLWAYCHVPNGSTMDMTAAIEKQIERFAPGFRELIIARAAHDPAAMERRNPNLVGGDIAGGYGGLSQLVRRPNLSPHPWATPLAGVYLCSASTPPGAGVHGMGGYHAARLALARRGTDQPHRLAPDGAATGACPGRTSGGDGLHQRDQHAFNRSEVTGVAQHERVAGVEVQRVPDLLRIVARGVVEAVDGDDERQPARLEVVDRGEAVAQPAHVGQDHRAEGTVGQLIPHEREALLPGHAEQVQHDPGAEGDPSEVQRHGRGGLAAHAGQVVKADAGGGQGLLGLQRPDLADRTDQGRLARPESARDEDLVRGEGGDGGSDAAGVVRARGGHSVSPGARRCRFSGQPIVARPP